MRDEPTKGRALEHIGRPGALVVKATAEAAELVKDWIVEIAHFIRTSDNPDDAFRALTLWADRREEDNRFADLIYQSAAMSWMAGQLFVRMFEVPNSARSLADVRVGSDASFLGRPFAAGVETFLERDILTPEEFYSKLGEFRQRGFTATRLATRALREKAYRQLLSALEGGSTFEEFAVAFLDEGPGVTRSYLKTVYDTNVATAYNAGKFRQLTHPDVVAQIPFRRYVTLQDPRVRDSHKPLHGKVWDSEDPEWHAFMPPLGFRCRCSITGASAEDVDPVHLAREVSHPDPNFTGPPTILIEG